MMKRFLVEYVSDCDPNALEPQECVVRAHDAEKAYAEFYRHDPENLDGWIIVSIQSVDPIDKEDRP